MSKKTRKQASRTSRPKTRQRTRPGRTAISISSTTALEPVTAPPAVLSPAQLVFCLAYLENGFVASQAYRAAHPKASIQTSEVEASRYLRIPKVGAYLAERFETILKPLQMGGEEVVARIAFVARDETERTRDRLLALRMLAEITGKARSLAGGIDELAAAIRADKEAHKDAINA